MDGTWDRRFADAADAFAQLFETHPGGGLPEAGAAFAVTVDGRSVLDCWGGTSDVARRQPWERDTVVCFFSCTKGVVALCALQLVDDGLLDPDEPVSRYWPEFAAGGKEAVTVAQLLSHQAGLPKLRAPLAPGGIWQWDTVVEAFAAEAPHWDPGTAHGYHTLSFGHLVGELVRRVTGQPISHVVRERVAGPLGVDLHVGAPASIHHLVAHLHDPPAGTALGAVAAAARAVDPAAITAYDDPHLLTPSVVNSPVWQAAEVPGANGHGNARALATMWGTLAAGGSSGDVRLLSPATIAAATEVQASGPDRTIGMHVSYGLGWMLSEGDRCFRPGSRAFWHGGAYGSLGHADPDARLGIGYVFNQCGEPQLDGRAQTLVDAVYRCL